MASCDALQHTITVPCQPAREFPLLCQSEREGTGTETDSGMEAGTGYSAFSSNLTAAVIGFGFLAG